MSSLIVNNHKEETQQQLPKSALHPNPSSLIPQSVVMLLKNNRNKKLEEMCYKLINFKLEINEAIIKRRNIPLSIPHHTFRTSIYNELEIMLTQCSHFVSPIAVTEKINETYKWFKDKMNDYFSLSAIKHETSLDKRESYSMPKEEEIKI